MLAYVPARSCHVQLTNESGKFSPPVFYGNMDTYLWCNWTILAGPGKHIIIYINGFQTNLNCDENQDEIIFEGVSSTVENSVVYACWNKYTHVYATEAVAVHIVFLWRSFSHISSSKYFEGKYYVFEDPDHRNTTSHHHCVLEPIMQSTLAIESTSKPRSEPSIPTVLDMTTYEQNSTAILPKNGKQMSWFPTDKASLTLNQKDQTFLPHTLDVTRAEDRLYSSLHSAEESSPNTNEEDVTGVLSYGEHHTMAETPLQHFTNPITGYIVIPSTTDMAALERFPYPTKDPAEGYNNTYSTSNIEEVAVISSFAELQNSLFENIVPSFTLQTMDASYIPDISILTSNDASLHFFIHPTEDSTTTTIGEEHGAVHNNGDHLLLETSLTSYTLHLPDLTSVRDTLVLKTEAVSLRYSMSPINSSISGIKSDQFLGNLDYGEHFLVEGILPSITLKDLASSRSAEEILEFTHNGEQASSGTSSTPLTTYIEEEISNPVTTESDLVTDNVESSLTPAFLSDDDIVKYMRGLPFNYVEEDNEILDDYMEILTPPDLLSNKTDQKDATPKSILGTQKTELPTSQEFTANSKFLNMKKTVFGPNHSLLTKELSKTPILDAVEPSFIAPFIFRTKDILASIPFDIMEEGKILKKSLDTHATYPLLDRNQILGIFPSNVPSPAVHVFNTMDTKDIDPMQKVNMIISDKVLDEAEQVNPSQIDTQPRDGRYNFLDSSISTSRVIIEEQERSTYSYRSSDSNQFILEAEQPNKEETTTYTENKIDLGIPHPPGDRLFAISVELEHKGILSDELESKIIESTTQKIQEKMVYLPITDSSLLLKKLKRPEENRVTLIYWLYLKNRGRGSDIANLLEIQLNDLTNTSLGALNGTLLSFSVEDVNECHTGIQQCDVHAYCLDEFGTYSCQCMNGYKDQSPASPGTVCISAQLTGFHILYDNLEILIGSILAVVAILLVTVIVLCVLLKAKHIKGNFNLQDCTMAPSSSHQKSSLPQQSDSSLNLSKPTGCLPSRHSAEHGPTLEASSMLELTRISVEQTAC
ncbi:N-acetyllactosaminide beta-1,3-N-acetylglucosaminyltransferase 2 isoform X4 [Pelobates cultripes]|uniref:N-acetyllactosaminide beta-1,3-N-acetylglucosaminyltransferase 2 isoform X4 n=1 Tax=Pelobates cultripes TaxID=61616 RepID=A0AAD1VTV7_PELCU|nr:N-acetyllactosaminide beta-1,3-N-acetylglucosaminyltransferase 2 isoform X4 [Pelobates cultripes]